MEGGEEFAGKQRREAVVFPGDAHRVEETIV
jgi:hypothetical protein